MVISMSVQSNAARTSSVFFVSMNSEISLIFCPLSSNVRNQTYSLL